MSTNGSRKPTAKQLLAIRHTDTTDTHTHLAGIVGLPTEDSAGSHREVTIGRHDARRLAPQLQGLRETHVGAKHMLSQNSAASRGIASRGIAVAP